MFLVVNMFDLYITICNKTLEVIILDCDVLRTRSYSWRNHECDRPLIVFVNCDYIFFYTTQYRRGVFLKLEYTLNFLHNTYKR